jgi:hypothetical protein
VLVWFSLAAIERLQGHDQASQGYQNQADRWIAEASEAKPTHVGSYPSMVRVQASRLREWLAHNCSG